MITPIKTSPKIYRHAFIQVHFQPEIYYMSIRGVLIKAKHIADIIYC